MRGHEKRRCTYVGDPVLLGLDSRGVDLPLVCLGDLFVNNNNNNIEMQGKGKGRKWSGVKKQKERGYTTIVSKRILVVSRLLSFHRSHKKNKSVE